MLIVHVDPSSSHTPDIDPLPATSPTHDAQNASPSSTTDAPSSDPPVGIGPISMSQPPTVNVQSSADIVSVMPIAIPNAEPSAVQAPSVSGSQVGAAPHAVRPSDTNTKRMSFKAASVDSRSVP